jgi:hypothetical protein
VGPTFRDARGRVCRGFVVHRDGPAGLACRQRGAWAAVIVRYPDRPGEPGKIDQGMPAELAFDIDARMRGDVFDTPQERAARANAWR